MTSLMLLQLLLSSEIFVTTIIATIELRVIIYSLSTGVETTTHSTGIGTFVITFEAKIM